MRKIVATILCFTLLFGSLAGIASAEEAKTEGYKITSDTSVQKEQLKHFEELKAMFADMEKVDLAAVKAKYESTLQATVKTKQPVIDTNISAVLEAAVKGDMNKFQAKQAVDKGLQWFFYTEMTALTKAVPAELEAGKQAEAKALLDQAVELYYGTLSKTAVARDKKFGTETKDLLDNVVVPILGEAIQENDVVFYNVFRQMFDKTIIKIYVLATLTYAESAPAEKDAEIAKGKVTEGYFFFMPIHGSLSGGSKVDADFVKDTFASGDASKIKLDEIKAAISKALVAKASGYAIKTQANMDKGDIATALVTAMEGNMFVAALETFITEKLGAEANISLGEHAEAYFNAVADENKKVANAHVVEIFKVVSKLHGVSLKLNTKSLTVAGVKVEVDAASFVSAETKRTLVPTRFVAEALGAKVGYDNATQKVTIDLNGKKVELVLGSDQVIVDGQVKADVKLDQTVVVKDGRSYIPLRAVAELFGNKVLYSNGEIVILP